MKKKRKEKQRKNIEIVTNEFSSSLVSFFFTKIYNIYLLHACRYSVIDV